MPERLQPFLVGREYEYGVFQPGRSYRSLILEILRRARERFPSARGDRHGRTMDRYTVFTEGEVLYMDPCCRGREDWYNLEAALYESDDPWMLQQRLVQAEARLALVAAEMERDAGLAPGSIRILALGDDFYFGRTRGYHFNYLYPKRLAELDHATLVLWIVASSALLGAGGLGGPRGVLCDGRVDHLSVAVGGAAGNDETQRGLFHTGRGCICGGRGIRIHLQHQGNLRLSLVLADGLTMLLLKGIEAGALSCADPLVDPVGQMKRMNRSLDPLGFRLRRVSGTEIPVLDVLEAFAESMRRFAGRHRAALPDWGERRILPAFEWILRVARRADARRLSRRLDAWLRWRLYREIAQERFGVSLAALAPWMPIAALLGRARVFRDWPGPGAPGRRPPACIADLRPDLGKKTLGAVDRRVEENRLDPDDPAFPIYVEAIRTLADVEFSLGSAREDNPLPVLIRGGLARPLFRERFRGDPFAPPPRACNRSRPRSVLIKRAAGRSQRLHVTWNSVVDPTNESTGRERRPRIYDLSDPLTMRIPRGRAFPARERRGRREEDDRRAACEQMLLTAMMLDDLGL